MAIADRTIAPPQAKAPGQRLRLLPIIIIAASAIVVIGLVRIVQTSQATTASFEMASLRQEKVELEASISQLEAEVASLSSLERIEREAARLGLTQPVSTSYLQVEEVWPAAADDALPLRFAPAAEDEETGDTS